MFLDKGVSEAINLCALFVLVCGPWLNHDIPEATPESLSLTTQQSPEFSLESHHALFLLRQQIVPFLKKVSMLGRQIVHSLDEFIAKSASFAISVVRKLMIDQARRL